jgi:large subunit ribosomal protein L31
MKNDIHPKWYPEATITCVCGNVFKVGSTQEAINIELCADCHPFYTGKQKLVDTARRVEKFTEKVAKKAKATTNKKAKLTAKAAKKSSKKGEK